MQAKDIMTEGVVCLGVKESIFDAAELMLGAGVSAVPVVNDKGEVVGIVSEADLLRRAEIDTAPRKSWLSRLLDSEVELRPRLRGGSCAQGLRRHDQGSRDGGRASDPGRPGGAHREARHQAHSDRAGWKACRRREPRRPSRSAVVEGAGGPRGPADRQGVAPGRHRGARNIVLGRRSGRRTFSPTMAWSICGASWRTTRCERPIASRPRTCPE